MNKALPDDIVMNLVELAQVRPAGEREAFLESACEGNVDLLAEVREYLAWEERMEGFLREPVLPRPPADVRFEPGELLVGRFRIVREIAEGGMGRVYEALDERLDRRIALKCARSGHDSRLPPEVRHASEVSHPNVCKIFEIHTATTDRGAVDFITMELLEGKTLAARLMRGKLPEAEARAIARQIAAGVAEAHRHQVVHGDLKTNNIILTAGPDGATRAVVMDFGLARRPGASLRTAQSEQVGGTPGYMAPELWKGQKVTARSDVYALGVMLYELASGKRPDQEATATAAEFWHARLHEKPGRVNRRWDKIIARCCEPKPEARYEDASAVAKALAPTMTRRRVASASAAVVLAAISGWVTYQRATAPAQTVRLAVLPFAGPGELSSVADRLVRDATERISGLQSSDRVGLTVVPLERVLGANISDAGAAGASLAATHVLSARLAPAADGRTELQARIVDTKTNAAVHQWSGSYGGGEWKLAPAALAGVVTAAFHLPGVPVAPVNAAAQADYGAGLSALRRLSQVDAALAAMERAVAADPDSALTHIGLSEARWLKFSWTQDKRWLALAEQSVRDAEARAPDVAAGHRARAVVLLSNGMYEQALAACRRAIELEPANGDGYRRMGQILAANGQSAEGEAALRKAVELEPGYFRNHQILASHLVQRGDDRSGVEEYRRAVTLEPEESYLRIRLALTLKNLGQFDDAEKELRAIRGATLDADVLAELGNVSVYRGRDAEAAKYLAQAAGLRPNDLALAASLGLALKRSGEKSRARAAFLKALALTEASLAADPRNARDRAVLGYVLAELGQPSRALAEVAQALRLAPDSSDVQWSAVQAYEALGRRELTLAVVDRFTPGMLEDAKRWPVLDMLRQDPRFLKVSGLRRQ